MEDYLYSLMKMEIPLILNRQIKIDEVDFTNQEFWSFYFHVNFPNGYDEETEMTMGEMVEEIIPINIEWVNSFTQYYDGVFDERDGYLDDPTTLKASLNCTEVLKIEFHPGDVIFFIDEKEIGCTGPHHITQSYPYKKLEQLLDDSKGALLFLLLLPMAIVETAYLDTACQTIERLLHNIFPANSCNSLAQCIVHSLMTD